jgi:hypothetical protein
MPHAELHLTTLSVDDEAAYSAWLAAHPQAMFYHTLPYLRMICELTSGALTIHLVREADGPIRGALPILQRNGIFGTVLNSLPYYGSHGGVIYDTPEAARLLMAHWNTLSHAPGVASATIIENLRDDADYAAQATHELSDIRIGQLTDIACSADHAASLMQRYHSKTRNMVRKAEKQGFEVSIENNAFDFLYNTHFQNMQVIGGTPKSRDFFDAVPKHFMAGKDYNIWVARHEGAPIAAMLLFYFRDMVEYFTPVIVEQWREAQPLSLLIYRAMTAASEAGFYYWNWGGTWVNQEGVYHFKKRWGAEDKKYFYYTHIENAALYNATPAELLQHYPGFFTLPFSSLTTKE